MRDNSAFAGAAAALAQPGHAAATVGVTVASSRFTAAL